MTEKEQDALPVVEQEAPGKPTPVVSGGSADAGSATVGPDVLKELAEVRERLAKLPDEIDARFKSGKDKRFAKVDEIYQWVKDAGGDPSKIAGKLDRQELVERLEALEKPEVQSGAPGRVAVADAETRTARFLNDLKDESGIELSDEELKQIWDGKRYTNWDDAFKDAKKAAWKKAKQANIGAGAVASSPGASAPSKDDEALAKELADIQAGKQGSPVSPENKKRRAEIKAKLAATRR